MQQGESTLEETADARMTNWRREDGNNHYKQLIEETDRLGWDCLVEGRVSIKWIEYAKDRFK